MKKTLISLICYLILIAPVAGQEAVPADPKPDKPPIDIRHEVGLNFTYLIKQFISISDSTIATSPYLVTYKSVFNNVGIRLGAGATYKKREQSEEDFEDSTRETNFSFDGRLGVEWQKSFNHRWAACFGIDGVVSLVSQKFVVDSGFDVFTEKEEVLGYGGGPVIGLYYHFNRYLSLYTEGSLYFLQKETESGREFTNFPQFDDNLAKITETELEVTLPATLYLVFRF